MQEPLDKIVGTMCLLQRPDLIITRGQIIVKNHLDECLRSGWTMDGQRVFVSFNPTKQKYVLHTRWANLVSFTCVYDAIDTFEAMELLDCQNLQATIGFLKKEIERTPRYKSAAQNTQARISYLVNCVENRQDGKRLKISGSKGSVEQWVVNAQPNKTSKKG